MDNYGLNMQGSFIVQKVEVLGAWTSVDMGRLIYEVSTGQYWLGGDSIDDGSNGWIPIGLVEGTVKDYHIDWDTSLTYGVGKISATTIPCLYDSSLITNVQVVVDNLLDLINGLSTGELIEDDAITTDHINFTASSIPIDNASGFFTGPDAKIEDALNELVQFTAADWNLYGTAFGDKLDINANTIQEALIGLEDFIDEIDGTDISVTYGGNPTPTILQAALDALYGLIDQKKYIQLIDTPSNYGTSGQVVTSTGSGLSFSSLQGTQVSCQYPSTSPATVQSALWLIQGELTAIENALTNITAEAQNVSYDNVTYTNVDDALDFLLQHSYTAANPPNAVAVTSTGIGGVDNVQESLEYLQNQLNQILGLVPCDVHADDVEYNAPTGHNDVKGTLDYVFYKFEDFQSQINAKADDDHIHAELYYTKTEVNDLIPDDYDSLYYRKPEVDALVSSNASNQMAWESNILSVNVTRLTLVTLEYTASQSQNVALFISFGWQVPVDDLDMEVYIRLERNGLYLYNSVVEIDNQSNTGTQFNMIQHDSILAGDYTYTLSLATNHDTIYTYDRSIVLTQVTMATG